MLQLLLLSSLVLLFTVIIFITIAFAAIAIIIFFYLIILYTHQVTDVSAVNVTKITTEARLSRIHMQAVFW